MPGCVPHTSVPARGGDLTQALRHGVGPVMPGAIVEVPAGKGNLADHLG